MEFEMTRHTCSTYETGTPCALKKISVFSGLSNFCSSRCMSSAIAFRYPSLKYLHASQPFQPLHMQDYPLSKAAVSPVRACFAELPPCNSFKNHCSLP